MSFVKSTLNPQGQNHLLMSLASAIVQATWISLEGFQFGLGDAQSFHLAAVKGPKGNELLDLGYMDSYCCSYPWEK